MPRKRQRSRGGRPSKFTATTALAIVAEMAGGTPRNEAARGAGVGASTLYRWLQKGRAGDPRYAPLVQATRGARDGWASMSVLTELAIFKYRL